MFRRSRFSARPNISTAGRAAATPQEAPSVNQDASETPKDASESSTVTTVTDKPVVTPTEKPSASGDGNDQNGEGTSSSAAVQRRKRFSVKPKVAPGRPSSLARTPKSPVKAVSETPVDVSVSDLDKPSTSSQTATTATSQGLQSPRRRRRSEESKQPNVQPKPTLIPSDSSGLSAVPPTEDPQEQTHLPADSGKHLESISDRQVKEAPSRLRDKVPPSLPDKEANEISEKAKTLVTSKSGPSVSQAAFSLSRLLNDPSDIQRLEKARKLRELLRKEMHKEKRIRKPKSRAKEFTLDPAKMTMRDLIRYLPASNPMTSSLEDPAAENETVVPPSPGREESPERAQEPEVPPKIASPREEEEEEQAAEEEAEEEQEEALMVPQVKVAEDGSLIIDEESLTVEVQRAKGPNPIQDRDPIFERGSTTTYSSFRKGTHTKPWSSEETDMFFLAISMVGTDFSMICQLFPHRARSEVKNKFKKEERENAWRIDKAFRERRKLDIEYFSKLLEKILEVQRNRKKLKSLAEKNSPRKQKRKAKGKKAAKKLSDVEEEDEEGENEMPDLEEEEEGEKENEDLCNEGGSLVSKPKKKRKRQNKQDASTKEPNDKKSKTGEKGNEQDEAYIPEDTEAALPEDHTDSDKSKKTENVNAAKDAAVKPAKLSRGRATKPLLPLGRKWGKKPPSSFTKAKDAASDKEEESSSDRASKEQVDKDASPVRQANKKSANDDISSEEEEVTVQPPRPTRYGRVPKLTKTLTYPAKEDTQSSASETTPASPVASTASAAKPKLKCTTKRGRSSKSQSTQESKKPKLITLRASQSEFSDEENEKQWEAEEVEEEQLACSSSKDSTALAFVPASLRSPHPVIQEVEETMEELDILANMPDVLGISKDALCSDASFELVQNETGTAEPCEHQLDLLVDVIDFLSSEHTEVSEDESYNEAAQTLLTIGNLAHLSQSVQNQIAIQDCTTGEISVSVDETGQHVEVELASEPAEQEKISATALMSATSAQEVTETPETVATVELPNSSTDSGDTSVVESSEQRAGDDMDSTPQSQSSPQRSKDSSPQTWRRRVSKVKPKPNLGRSPRTAQARSQPGTSTVNTCKDTVAPDPSQAAETVATDPEIADCSQKLTIAELAEEPSGSPGRSIDHVKSGSGSLDQSTSESYCLSDARLEPSLEQTTRESTDETPMSHFETTKSSSSNLISSDSAGTESQDEKTMVEVEGESTCATSSEKPNHSADPASDLPPTLDLGSALMLAEEMSTTEEKKTDVGICQVESDAATSDQNASENQNTRPTSDSTEGKLMSDVVTTESSCSNPLASDSAHSEPQVGQRSNKDSAPVQESSDHPAPCVTAAGDLPASQKEKSEAASTCQTRKTRLSRVKPKPNLTPAPRMVHSERQTTKDTVKKDSDPKPKCLGRTVVAVEAEPTCSTSPKKPSHSADLAEDLLPQLDLGFAGTPTEEASAAEEKKKDTAETSDQSSQEKQNTKPTSECTEEKIMSDVETTESSYSNPLASDSAVSEPQVGQRSNKDSALVQESSDHSTPCVTAVEDLPASQKKESEASSTCQTRKTRLSRVKPKPNLVQTSRMVHSKPQTTKNTVEKNSTPNSKLNEKAMVEVEAEPTCSTFPKKSSPDTGSAEDFLPSLDEGSSLTPTDELSTAGEKNTDMRVVSQVESSASTSDRSVPENQNFSEAQFDLSRDQATRDTRETSESTEEKLMSDVETTERSLNVLQTSDSAVPQSQVGQWSDTGQAPIQEGTDHPAPCVTDLEELPVSQKDESEVTSTLHTRRGRSQKVKPKPNLPQTSRTVRSKSQTTNPAAHMQLVEKPSSPTPRPESMDTIPEAEAAPTFSTTSSRKPVQIESTDTASFAVPSLELYSTHELTGELSSTESQKMDAQSAVDSCLEDSEKNEQQRKRRFPKIKPKPNLRSSTRPTRTKLQSDDVSKPSEVHHVDMSSNITSEQRSVDNTDAESQLKLAEKDSEHLTSTHSSLYTGPPSSTNLGPAESEKSLDNTNDKGTSSDGIFTASSLVTEQSSGTRDSVLKNRGNEKPLVEGKSTVDKAEIGPASQSGCKQDMSIGATETNIQLTDGPHTVSDVHSSEDESTKSKIKPSETQSAVDPKEKRTRKSNSENDSEAPSEDAVHECSETTETHQSAAQSSDDNRAESADSSKSSRKAPPTRRGRLVKPKPNLGPRSQPPKSQQIQNIKQADADLESVVPSVSHEPVSDVRHVIQIPVEGATEQESNQKHPPHDAMSLLGCVTQVPDSSNQGASTSSAGGTQSQPSLPIFPGMLDQVPADPDEPFFILSLTEIPVSSSGEMMDSACEPLPYLPVTDASVQQQSSVPVEGLAAAADGPLCNVAMPVSMEEIESRTVQSSTLPETTENNEVTEQRQRDAGRTAKLQVKSRAPRRKQTSETLSAKEAESITTQESEPPWPSVQPKASDEVVTRPQTGSGDNVNVEKEAPIGGKDLEESSSGAPTTRTTGSRIQRSSTVQAASKGQNVKTPHAAGQRSSKSPVASTSYDVVTTSSQSQPPEETRRAPSTTSPTQAEVHVEQTSEPSMLRSDQTIKTSSTSLPSTAEVSASQQSEEEPTNISQYFFSDIFTDVEQSELPGPSVQAKALDEVVTGPQTESNDTVNVEKEAPTDGKDLGESSSRAPATQTRRRRIQKSAVQAASKGRNVKTPRATGRRTAASPIASTSYDVATVSSQSQPPEETHSAPSTTSPTQAEVHIDQTSEPELRSDQTPSTSLLSTVEVSASQRSENVENSSVEEEPANVSQYFFSDIFTDVEET